MTAGFSGGPAGPAGAALLWPLLAATASGGRVDRGLGATVAAALAAAGLGVVAGPSSGGPGTGFVVVVALGAAAVFASATMASAASRIADARAQARRDAERAAEAQRAAEEARGLVEGRARFMAEMSHEIRTPLNAILGFADAMRMGVFGALPDRYGEYAGHIHDSGAHLLDLVSDLLDLSKIDAGRYALKREPIELGAVAQEAVRLSGALARSEGVSLRVEAGAAVALAADGRALRQMALNLVSNAIKFTPAGGRVTVRARALDPSSRDGDVVLEVVDTGVGLAPDQLARLAEPYAQADNQPDRPGARGTGLGLALVKRLAELHGGRLELASELGVGTTARIVLPRGATPGTDQVAEANA